MMLLVGRLELTQAHERLPCVVRPKCYPSATIRLPFGQQPSPRGCRLGSFPMGRVSGLGVWVLASAARRPPLEVLTTIPADARRRTSRISASGPFNCHYRLGKSDPVSSPRRGRTRPSSTRTGALDWPLDPPQSRPAKPLRLRRLRHGGASRGTRLSLHGRRTRHNAASACAKR